ncbi:ankyrin repeat-containing protein At5g02620-like [Vitis riparia]|uniref:ankyrin repeat-containing protein At5g02620-like n=1 Tax=Vitis riparia TaxID=96939 RepID=UPI00155AEDB8|nr:ankyrin repeat-containing protein At5g02620-like [Vitis riparia]
MDLSTSIHTAESHTLYLEQLAAQDGSQTQISNQAADADGSQTPITCMDAALYEAAAYGRIDVLKQMSEDHFVVQLTPNKNTVLHIAAQFGQLDCVQYILGLNSSSSLLLKPNLKGDTPLHHAAREGHLTVVKALIDAAKRLHQEIESGVGGDKAIMRMKNEEENTALHEAVRYHHSEVVKSLTEEDPEFIYGANIAGYTLLYMAAERGFEDLVNLILGTCTSPSYSGMMGRTALHAAVIRNNQEITARLLEWKPDLTKEVDEKGWSPLHCAAYFGHTEIVEQLLAKSPDKSVTYLGIKDSKKTALHIAANRNHQDIVKLLLSRFPDCCEQVDDKGNNVLHFAMMSEQHFATSYILVENSLLQVRRLMNEKDAKGDTPLHLLASYQVLDTYWPKDNRVDKMALNKDKLTAPDIFSRANVKPRASMNMKEIRSQWREWEKEVVGPFSWQEAINEDSGGTSDGNNSKSEDVEKDKRISTTKRQGGTHLIVAALVATVTFAAGFTLPGGYNDNGMAILTKRADFKAFIVIDTIAVILSLSAVLVYFSMSFHEDEDFLDKHLIMGVVLTVSSMGAMVFAFMTGLNAVLPLSSGLPTVIYIICCIFLLVYYFVYRQLPKDENKYLSL